MARTVSTREMLTRDLGSTLEMLTMELGSTLEMLTMELGSKSRNSIGNSCVVVQVILI